MKILSLTLTSLAVLSLAACSTTSPEDTLLSGISDDKIKTTTVSADDVGTVTSSAARLAESQIRGSVYNPTCAQFNMNALALSATPTTPSAGTGLMKTIALGVIAGVASGGVASLGIGSAFVEATAVGTANQVIFNGATPIVDKVIPDSSVGLTERGIALQDSAERVGCPNPTWAQELSPKEAAALLAKFELERKAAEKIGG